MEIDGRIFSLTIASDVERDGIGVELYELVDNKTHFLADIFRCDSKKQILFSTANAEIPYKALLWLQDCFEKEIPKEFLD